MKIAWLRWIFLFPLAIALAFAANFILGMLLITMRIRNQAFIDGTTAFVGRFLIVFFVGILAPSKHSKTAVIASSVLFVLDILVLIITPLKVEGLTEGFITSQQLYLTTFYALGMLYALFLVPPLTTPQTMLEQLWKEIRTLGVLVVLFGGIISIIGIISGMIAKARFILTVGIVVIGMGIATWFFPFIHLFLRFQRLQKDAKDLFRKNQ